MYKKIVVRVRCWHKRLWGMFRFSKTFAGSHAREQISGWITRLFTAGYRRMSVSEEVKSGKKPRRKRR